MGGEQFLPGPCSQKAQPNNKLLKLRSSQDLCGVIGLWGLELTCC